MAAGKSKDRLRVKSLSRSPIREDVYDGVPLLDSVQRRVLVLDGLGAVGDARNILVGGGATVQEKVALRGGVCEGFFVGGEGVQKSAHLRQVPSTANSVGS